MAHLRKFGDRFSKLAKATGYPARSVFKLKEMDEKHRLLRPGYRVIDLGCSPGSWVKYAAERVGPSKDIGLDGTIVTVNVLLPEGFVLGMDLSRVKER